jgi:ABC transporter substrate binding protein (PQQ-dependent alcohol dehydrogenase system)
MQRPRQGTLNRLKAGRFIATLLTMTLLNLGLANPIIIGVVIPDTETFGDDPLLMAIAQAAEQGALMAEEEHAFNAELFGLDFSVLIERASGAEGVVAAAERLAEAGALAVAGGFNSLEANALTSWSVERSTAFLNIGASDNRLRNEGCAATSFHIEPSSGMYLDALAGWYVRSGFRNWFVLVGSDSEATDQFERLEWSLRERHFGARIVGRAGFNSGDRIDPIVNTLRRANSDLVVLLLSAADQLEVLAQLEEAGVRTLIAGFPYPEAQTRAFMLASRTAAPQLGSDHRILAWEPTLDAYGAREFNARFLAMFGVPMEPTAWATYQAVKVVFEAATLGGSATPADVIAYMAGPRGVFDVWKGIGVSFRPWDQQLRQSLYLSKISPSSDDLFRLALLVGELPAIYMPGTDPVERLDQLGDPKNRSTCTLNP